MSKELSSEICAHFGTGSVENLVANQRNRFIVVIQTIIFVKYSLIRFVCLAVFFIVRFFNFCSLIYSFILCYHIRR